MLFRLQDNSCGFFEFVPPGEVFKTLLWARSCGDRTASQEVSVLLSGGHRHLSHSCRHKGQFQSQAKVL